MNNIKKIGLIFGIVLFFLAGCTASESSSSTSETLSVTDYFSDGDYTLYSSFDEVAADDIVFERLDVVSYTNNDGDTHYYEVVYLPSGNINWVQAAYLAEQEGGYLACPTDVSENYFVWELVSSSNYWYEWNEDHNFVMNGPFIGGFQPDTSADADDGWMWLSGETWDYTNWAQDGATWDGEDADDDSRDNTQPNDSGGEIASDILCFGEMNIPVGYWGDFPRRFGTIGHLEDDEKGASYGFIIEYETDPTE